jgi:hypothetical protein
MKKFMLLCIGAVCLPASGQSVITENQSAGAQVASLPHSAPTPAVAVDGINYRTVTNQLFNIQKSILWRPVAGTILHKTAGGVLIVERTIGREVDTIALRNYSGESTDGKPINTLAMPVGAHERDGQTLELWDCGVAFKGQIPGLSAGQNTELQTIGDTIGRLKARKSVLEQTLRKRGELALALFRAKHPGKDFPSTKQELAEIHDSGSQPEREELNRITASLSSLNIRKLELELKK